MPLIILVIFGAAVFFSGASATSSFDEQTLTVGSFWSGAPRMLLGAACIAIAIVLWGRALLA